MFNLVGTILCSDYAYGKLNILHRSIMRTKKIYKYFENTEIDDVGIFNE